MITFQIWCLGRGIRTILYLSRPHLAEDVPEAKRFISCSRHDGLSVGGHGLNTNSSSRRE